MGSVLTAALAAVRPEVTVSAALSTAQAGGHPDPKVSELVEEIGITEILHFTTYPGLVGILGSGLLLSRSRLPDEKLLEYLYEPNTPVRKDPAWAPFVNMSVTQVNDWMFLTSSRRRQAEALWWTVLSFSPEILSHAGVVFTTTNNIYPTVRRATGAPGLAALFADTVYGRYGTVHTRDGLASNRPTDRQAEVLYPHSVDVKHLTRIYVQSPEHRDVVEGLYGALTLINEPEIECVPEVFS